MNILLLLISSRHKPESHACYPYVIYRNEVDLIGIRTVDGEILDLSAIVSTCVCCSAAFVMIMLTGTIKANCSTPVVSPCSLTLHPPELAIGIFNYEIIAVMLTNRYKDAIPCLH